MNPNTKLQPDRFAAAHAAGLRVFPVLPADKKPAVTWSEFAERTPTDDEILAWDASDFNVGVICGEPSEIVVLDVDDADAQAFVDTLQLPLTPLVVTGRGRHYYFRLPPSGLRNATGIAGHKLDLRGDGGYVVGAGSVHESGRPYEWQVGPDTVPFAEFPEQVLRLLGGNKPRRAKSANADVALPQGGRFDWWLNRELDKAVASVQAEGEGKRNDTLFACGVQIAKHVAGAAVEWAAFATEVGRAALAAGLGHDEIDRTLASCWETGSKEPTEWLVQARAWLHLAKPNVFYHVASGEYLKLDAFNNAFASLRLPDKRVSFARWLLDRGFISQVHDLDYRPDDPERFVERDGLTYFNTYVAPLVQAQDGDWEPFVDFLSHLVPDEGERDHLLKMIAWTVRRPGQKLRHALLLRSEVQGVGKTMLTEIWTQLLGERNVRKTTTEEVSSQFQGFIKETLLVVLEELNWGVGPTGYNRLKDIITGDIAVVNEKFIPVRHWPNLATLVLLTNIKTPMIIEDKDRRFFYIDSPAVKREPDYYAYFANWWREKIGVIRAFIDTIDIESFNPHAAPPMTAAKTALIADGREDLVKELADLIDERKGVFDRDLVTFDEIETELGNSMRGKSKTQLKIALGKLGAVALGQQWVDGKWDFGQLLRKKVRASLWAIRNVEFWSLADARDRADEYSREEGRFANLHGWPIGIRHASDWPADPRYMVAESTSRRMQAGEILRHIIAYFSRLTD